MTRPTFQVLRAGAFWGEDVGGWGAAGGAVREKSERRQRANAKFIVSLLRAPGHPVPESFGGFVGLVVVSEFNPQASHV